MGTKMRNSRLSDKIINDTGNWFVYGPITPTTRTRTIPSLFYRFTFHKFLMAHFPNTSYFHASFQLLSHTFHVPSYWYPSSTTSLPPATASHLTSRRQISNSRNNTLYHTLKTKLELLFTSAHHYFHYQPSVFIKCKHSSISTSLSSRTDS